jgi:RNA polymerase sigma-70 factor (ECF subfamily)
MGAAIIPAAFERRQCRPHLGPIEAGELSGPPVVTVPGQGRADTQESWRGMAEDESLQERAPRELDQALVARVQRGDNTAFDMLVRRYQHRVAALIGRYIYDWSEVQDVAQETFIRAYRAIGNFRGDAQFFTWLHRIAVNTAKNHLVAHHRRTPTDDIDPVDAEHFDSGSRLRETDTPERELMRHEIEQTLMRVVAALPDDLRGAITMREVDGLSYEDIAQRMGCPVGTVRSRIFRAREAIDDELRPLLGNEPKRERASR